MPNLFRSLPRASSVVRNFADDESGATAIEYGLIAAGIALVIVSTIFTIGSDVKTQLYDKVLAALATN